MSTESARAGLPASVPLADAAFNAARTGLAVVALTRRPELLPLALDDRLHQDQRLSRLPAARELFDRVREAGFPVCLAGSGPSLLVFERDDRRAPDPGAGWQAMRLGVDGEGASVMEG